MSRRHVHTIVKDEVGQSRILIEGHDYRVADFIGCLSGRVLEGDVGKQVYFVDGVLQVENDGQMDARLHPELYEKPAEAAGGREGA